MEAGAAQIAIDLFLYGKAPEKIDSESFQKSVAAVNDGTVGAFLEGLKTLVPSFAAVDNRLLIGGSLLTCLAATNLIPLIGESEEVVQAKLTDYKALFRYLTRPPSEYTPDDGFNIFLLVFHGYCLYDATVRGDFKGFSAWNFLPQLAVVVLLQVLSQLRLAYRGGKFGQNFRPSENDLIAENIRKTVKSDPLDKYRY